jgi:hypothetical protein
VKHFWYRKNKNEVDTAYLNASNDRAISNLSKISSFVINLSGFFIFLSSRSDSILDMKDSDRGPTESSSSLPGRGEWEGEGNEGEGEGVQLQSYR